MIPNSNILITKFPFRSSLSGVEKHTFEVVENLQNKNVNFILFSSCPVMLAEFRKKGWKNVRWWLGLPPVNLTTKLLFALSFLPASLSSLFGLIYCKYKFNIDKLYCLTLTEKLIMTPIARFLGLKVIWFEHLSIEPVISDNCYKFLYRFYSKGVKIVAISNFVKDELRKIGISNVAVVYHSIKLDQYKKQEDIFDIMAETRAQKYEKNNFTVGCVCRLEKIKGLEYLIKAIEILKEKITNIDLIIVGEGSQKENLMWLVEQFQLRNKVKFVGYKDNLVDWLNNFDVFVLSSLKESMGLVLLSAMASGLPVIATNVGGIPEIIKHGYDGILVEPQSPKDLAKAIMLLHEDEKIKNELISNAKNKVENNFQLKDMLESYERLLLE